MFSIFLKLLLKMKSRDKENKIKIKEKKTIKLTEIKETFSLQKKKYYNIITKENAYKGDWLKNVQKNHGTHKERN